MDLKKGKVVTIIDTPLLSTRLKSIRLTLGSPDLLQDS